MPKIGAHVSAAGPLDLTIDRAGNIGAETIQMFASPPQTWFYKGPKKEEIKAFLKKKEASQIDPVFLHGVYLINLATQSEELLDRSINSLIQYQNFAANINASGTIFHLGSHKGRGLDEVFTQVINAILKVLKNSPKNINLIIENSAGMGGSIGAKFKDIGKIIKTVGAPNLKICLDTQHTFASGYAIHTKEGLEKMLTEFDQKIVLDRLVIIHANDSKTPLASGLDRHENIGEGFIGREGFELILNHKLLANLPFIIETPGFAQTGPDKENIEILRSLVH